MTGNEEAAAMAGNEEAAAMAGNEEAAGMAGNGAEIQPREAPAGPPAETPPARKNRGPMSLLIGLLRPERPLLAVVGACTVLSVAFLVIGPVVLGAATNVLFDGVIAKNLPAGMTKAQIVAELRAHGHGVVAGMISAMNIVPGVGVDFTRLGQLLGVAAVVYVLSSLFNWAQSYLIAGIVQRTVYRLRQTVEDKLSRLPLRYFDTHPHGDLLSRVTNDIDNVTTALNNVLSQLLVSALTVVAVLGIMFWISPVLAGASVAVIPLVLVVTVMIARRSKVSFKDQWSQTGKLNGLVEETYTGHALVSAFGQRPSVLEEFDRQNKQLYQRSFRAQFLSGVIMPAVMLLGNLNYVVIATFGGYQVATGVLSLGAVQAFIQYSRRFTSPISQIAGQMNVLQSGLASVARVVEFLEEPEEAVLPAVTPSGPRPGGSVARLRFQDVSFRYEPQTPLIEGLTLEAAPGQTVAIVGPTGAGKTTLVNLLIRFYEIDRGQILLNDADYQDLSRDDVRRCFAMVLQDTWLFAGTVRENIGYGREGASDEEIVAAAQAAYVDDFVRTLPDGYATVLDGDASAVSSGQKQLLTIARAFLADPAILILDEATSSVDTRTEILIQDAMARLRAGRTSFVIAHRLSTVRDADTIVVMDAGRIIEQGGHEELLARRGFYHDLYNSQFARATALN